MRGLKIGDMHTYYDFDLKMLSLYISQPEPNVELRYIPGRSEMLDISEAIFGEVTYKSRSMKAIFEMYEPNGEIFFNRYSQICNYIHGQYCNIINDADPDFYYEGRLKVDYEPKNNLFYEIEINAELQPYKKKTRVTEVKWDVKTDKNILCMNSRQKVIPTIITNAAFRIEYDGRSFSVTAGTTTIPELLLNYGRNILHCYGTGNIAFIYREGSL